MNNKIPFKVVIIDDEPLARREVQRALEKYPEFEVIGEAGNVDDAYEQITFKCPDVIFLDIQMPGKSGFKLLEELKQLPEVVFTTAYDQYAVKAFEFNALDYMVKPIRDERFAKAMQKVMYELESKRISNNVSRTINRKIFIKDGKKMYFIKLTEISLIESVENYAKLYFNDEMAMVKSSLNQLEKKLNPELFFRANRQQIINMQHIVHVQTSFNNKLKLILSNKQSIEVSNRQSIKFKKLTRL
jgi:two-component system LytT family response regulator